MAMLSKKLILRWKELRKNISDYAEEVRQCTGGCAKKITDFTKIYNKSGGDKSKEMDTEIVRVNKIVQEVRKQVAEIE